MLLKEPHLRFLLFDNRQGKTNRSVLHNSLKLMNLWQVVIYGFVDYPLSHKPKSIIRLRLPGYDCLKITALLPT